MPPYIENPELAGVLSDGTFTLAMEDIGNPAERPAGFHETAIYLMRHGPSGELLDTIDAYSYRRLGYLSREIRYLGTPVFEPQTSLAAAGERFAVGRGSRPEIVLLDPDGVLRRIIRWSTPDRTVTSAELERFRRDILARFDDAERRRRFGEPQVSDDRPVNEQFPAHAAIRFDETGGLWVQRYPRPSWPDMRWWVFASDGRFVCHTTTRSEYARQILEVGARHMLVVERDELNVEYLRRYEIGAPGGA
ncbi:MAG: hypothetical protein ACOC8B_05240 [Gemmatimonadota bacterium]